MGTDHQAAVWGRGLNNAFSHCHIVRLRGPPVFVAGPGDGTASSLQGPGPFGVWTGERNITANVGTPLNVIFRAQDPNPEDLVRALPTAEKVVKLGLPARLE